MNKGINLERGHIYMCNLGETVGSEQGGTRPVLVIKNQKGIDNGSVVTIVPITSKINKGKKLPTHISVGTESGLLVDSELQVEQTTTKDKERFLFCNKYNNNYEVRKLGEVSDYILNRVETALSKDTGFIELYFNEKHAYHILDMLTSAMKANLDEIKNHFIHEFKNYCEQYNKDYKTVLSYYKANKTMNITDDLCVVSCGHRCS